ncbi:MAG: hypothetical protein K9J16_01385 [Melioribacteraceae bacterium]|nr:hypothetical protein [Melioribacteraceae bacterium]MCF8352836.1 hypothetical protein [Melioribacteraceae bacterium]MCF8393444.1 hypothetical protein [Melioribacteraceae bacterium]MCF8417353.1 hypothetical protein [Melioribacteraceae bacterium]
MRIFFITVILLIVSQFIYGENADTLKLGVNDQYVVDSLKIIGNDITEEFIILREMTFSEGDTVDAKLLKYNRERIYSLGLFNFVNLYLREYNNKIFCHIEVKESWYIYPIPFIDLNDRTSFERASYGINVLYKNFRGRDETINFIFSFGYDPKYLLAYYIPVLIESHDISFQFSVSYGTIANKSQLAEYYYGEEFSYKVMGSTISFGKRFDQFNNLFVHSGFDYITAPEDAVNFSTGSNINIDRSIKLGLDYVYDSRDLKQFPSDGIYFTSGITHKGFGLDGLNYNVFRIDFREYRKIIDKITAKWRTTYRHTFGAVVPTYDYSYFGFNEYVRGHQVNQREGNNYILSSVELSYPLLKEWNFSIDLPLLPKRLTSSRIGININSFFDTGIVYFNGEPIHFDKFNSGWGLGLTILFLPYNSVRLEYAFNENWKGEILLGTGFSF